MRVCFDDDDIHDAIDEINVVKATISQVLKVPPFRAAQVSPQSLNPIESLSYSITSQRSFHVCMNRRMNAKVHWIAEEPEQVPDAWE